MYQLRRLSLGKATSFAPIICGIKKFPSTAGMEGIRKKKIIATPCMVKSLLYVSGDTRAPSGVSKWTRIMVAKTPPTKKKKVTETSYKRAMRVWPEGTSQERMP